MMLPTIFSSALVAAALLTGSTTATPSPPRRHVVHKRAATISPKVVIIDMFDSEAGAWYGIPDFDVLAQNITVPGLSPLYPDVHCTANGEICQVVTGEGEINAASTITAFALSDQFNLTSTYFLIAGIAGVNPEVATIGGVTLARYAVQVALQYEIDAREIPANFSTGYVPFGTDAPGMYPTSEYGTEVFELSESLRNMAFQWASKAALNDTADAQANRALYNASSAYTAGATGPSIVKCDTATSDNWFTGDLLSEAFTNTTTLFTNNSGIYCATAQEDNGTLEALLRAAYANLTDFSRIILMRTASDFDRPAPGVSILDNLFYSDFPGFDPSISNIYLAGIEIVNGILDGWNSTFHAGLTNQTNYVGDIFDTLGGSPDFGQPDLFIADYPGNGGFGKRDVLRRGDRKGRAGIMKKQKQKKSVGNARMRLKGKSVRM